MREVFASRVRGDIRHPGQKTEALPVIIAGLFASCSALFLCFLATVFGVGAEGGWLTLPPDYTVFGWVARTLGGALGLAAFLHLCLIHRRYKSQLRRRKRRRSHAGMLLRISLAISVACIVWEIAILALVLLMMLVLAYGLFADDGF